LKNKLILLIISSLLFCGISEITAQIKLHTIGLEGQVYPTGYLPGLRAEFSIAAKQALELRVGANIFDHEDFGVQQEEVGDGLGFTLGYRYYFSPQKKKWFVGVRSDFWWNTVDWRNSGVAGIMEGTTEIFVIQPTAITGFVWAVSDNFYITSTIAAGFEINAITDGAPTGEGAILLGGINLDYRF